MTRRDEYEKLVQTLAETPAQLDDTVQKAEIRLRFRHRKRLFVTMPAASLAALLLVFVMLVNLFPTVAYACGRIPLLKDLAQLVAISPSLSAAIENEYVQLVGQEQTANGITARIEYVIVDQVQLNVFYSVTSDAYEFMTMRPKIKAAPGDVELEGYSLRQSGGFARENGQLNYFTVDFVKDDMPDALQLILQVKDAGSPFSVAHEPAAPADAVPPSGEPDEEDFAAAFTFDVSFDPYYTAQGEVLALDKTFKLSDQQLMLKSAEIYPTHSNLNFEDVSGNTAWMVGLKYYLENEKGERFEPIGNGISATGSADSPMMESQHMESVFFSQSKKLTLYITGVTWLDKDYEKVRIDLADVTAGQLPRGIEFESAEKTPVGWAVTFTAPQYKQGSSYQLFSSTYYDEYGHSYMNRQWSTLTADYINEDGAEDPSRFTVSFTLKDYPYDVVYLMPSFTRIDMLTEPVAVPIK